MQIDVRMLHKGATKKRLQSDDIFKLNQQLFQVVHEKGLDHA
jgi:hypothetical protein